VKHKGEYDMKCAEIEVNGQTYVRKSDVTTGVLQDWLASIGLKMQSILLSGLRSPDIKATSTKRCVRWLRGISQRDGDPEKQDYMEKVKMSEELIWEAMEELQYLSVHYVHHFADSFAVVAYYHPDSSIREFAILVHSLVAVELFHFKPESETEFKERHRDNYGKKDTKESIANKAKQLFKGLKRQDLEPHARSY
jgi:hypothetical protein